MLAIAFTINLIIVIFEILTLGHIRGKRNILKYYTYLQNFLGLTVSLIFCVCLTVCFLSGKAIPEFLRGLRYVATCGLLAAMFVFIAFLGGGTKIAMTESDFIRGFSPRKANIILHYICPMLSCASFLLFEKDIPVSNGIWTALAPVPSCVYWAVYMILTFTKAWEEPYRFTAQDGKTWIWDIVSVVLIPFSFLAISYILWNVK